MAENKPNAAQAMLAQMGGVSGMIYSSLPVVVFVPISTTLGLMPAIGAALGVAALILLWRLVRHESAQPAISGFFGVGISALIAYIVGESKGYFLLGIWMSLVWAVVFMLSIVVRRPAVGYIWGWVNSHDRNWRRIRKAVTAFDLATFVWVLVFTSRFVVQQHLRSEEHTSELQSRRDLVCRLLLEKKKQNTTADSHSESSRRTSLQESRFLDFSANPLPPLF